MPLDQPTAAVIAASLQAGGVILAAVIAVGLAGRRAQDEHRARIAVESLEALRKERARLTSDLHERLHTGLHFGSITAALAEAGEAHGSNPTLIEFVVKAREWHNGVNGVYARFAGYVTDPEIVDPAALALVTVVQFHEAVAKAGNTGNVATLQDDLEATARVLGRFDEAVTAYLRKINRETEALVLRR